MTSLSLTAEQEKIYIENEKLVYHIINQYIKNPGMYGLNDYEDLVQIGRTALCKSIKTYKADSKAKFSSYACIVIRNALYVATRNASEEAFDDSLSMTDEFVELNANLAYDSIVSAEDNILFEQGLNILNNCEEKYSGIASKGVKAIKLMTMGYSTKDIAEMFDVKQNVVTSWISRARQKLRKEPELLALLEMP